MVVVGNIFPVKHFADAMRAGFLGNVMVPTLDGPAQAFPFDWWDLADRRGVGHRSDWSLATRFFSWEPRK